jgi:hypothetical protein
MDLSHTILQLTTTLLNLLPVYKLQSSCEKSGSHGVEREDGCLLGCWCSIVWHKLTDVSEVPPACNKTQATQKTATFSRDCSHSSLHTGCNCISSQNSSLLTCPHNSFAGVQILHLSTAISPISLQTLLLNFHTPPSVVRHDERVPLDGGM